MEDYKTIEEMRNRIRIERAILDITQADLAGRIQVSRQTINAIESNKYVPSAILAMKIARVFGKPVEEIFELDENDWLPLNSYPILKWYEFISELS